MAVKNNRRMLLRNFIASPKDDIQEGRDRCVQRTSCHPQKEEIRGRDGNDCQWGRRGCSADVHAMAVRREQSSSTPWMAAMDEAQQYRSPKAAVRLIQ